MVKRGRINQISPADVRERMLGDGDGLLLVCAHESDEEFERIEISGAIPFQDFKLRAESLPKDQEIVFYCDSADQFLSTGRAEEYRELGYRNAKFLEGGYEGWLESAEELYPTQPEDAPGGEEDIFGREDVDDERPM